MKKGMKIVRFIGIVCWFLALFILINGHQEKKKAAEEAAKQQAAYTPRHLAGTDTAQPGSLAQTGDRAGLIGETFVIGGTVLVAAGVFLDQKKRREQM